MTTPQIDEPAIRALCVQGAIEPAATAALRLYGAEVMGLQITLHRDLDDAEDAFALFAQRLWQTLPLFAWQCSLRTWAYRLARNASADVNRRNARRGRRQVRMSTDGGFEQVQQQVRTATLSFLRTERRTELEKLRDSLPEEDRILLILRLDRKMAWREIAGVLLGESAQVSGADAELDRETVRLRKRFQLVKDRLRQLGRERGLL